MTAHQKHRHQYDQISSLSCLHRPLGFHDGLRSISKRTELAKGDLTGKDMDIIVSTVEVPPGASGVMHTHPGEEAHYVIDGATAILPDGKQVTFEPGVAKINVRGVPHGAFTFTGDKTLKLLTVHIVDKGKPMTTAVK